VIRVIRHQFTQRVVAYVVLAGVGAALLYLIIR